MRALTRIIPPRARSRRGLALSVSFGALAGLIVVVQAWLLAAAISGAFLGGAGLPEVEGPLAASAVLRAGSSRRPEPSPGAPPPAIRFEGVRCAYGPDRSPALDGLTIALPAGATVALLGPSGSGKTTAARLLLRFLEPDRGAIAVDGAPLAALAPEEWRRRVAVVPQRQRLFHGSLRDNVLLARPGASPDELEQAGSRARLDAVLRELPQGWETPVGEGGERLSGGQAQRVALARAYLKDAPVLVLDEPSAHLDPASEAEVVEAMEGLRRGRTVLLIAHRLTPVARADRVALLVRGRIVEEGPPAELAAKGHAYPRLLAAWEGTW